MENEAPKRGRVMKAGPGRPKGSLNKRTREMIARAERLGLLPHEILLEVARGHPLEETHIHPETGEKVITYTAPADIDKRLQAARDAAPYYAPKLQTVEVIQGLNDDSLDQLITQLAAEAGISLTPDGEGEEGEEEEADRGSPRPRRRFRSD